jgi:hypothetical protein
VAKLPLSDSPHPLFGLLRKRVADAPVEQHAGIIQRAIAEAGWKIITDVEITDAELKGGGRLLWPAMDLLRKYAGP